jgi:hypothetical protein
MICYSYSLDKSRFLALGLSEYSSVISGYEFPESYLDAYRSENISLFPKQEDDAYRAKVFLFTVTLDSFLFTTTLLSFLFTTTLI